MTVCEHSQKDLWNALICGDDDIYYHWAYSDTFYHMGSGQPTLFYLSDGRTRIYTVLMIRKISSIEPFNDFDNFYDVATPYGYGGTALKGPPNETLLSQFFNEMSTYLIQHNVVAEYSRLDPVSGNVGLYAGQPYDCTDFSKTVCMRLHSPEQILSDMKSECRNRIRKAAKNAVTVVSGFDTRYMAIFRDVYYETMKRHNTKPYYFFNDAFFRSTLSNFKEHAHIYLAICNDIPISAILILYSAGNALYHLGGSRTEFMKIGANNLLFLEASIDLLNKGCRTLLLGGGFGGAEDSLFRFKKTLAPSGVLDCHVAKRIYNTATYNELVGIKNGIRPGFAENSSFFPVYRA